MLTAEAHLQTEAASAYLIGLCRQLEEKATARARARVRIESSDTDATADFGWGRCTMHAGPAALTLRVQAGDTEALGALQELFTRHLEHASAGALRVEWQQAATPTGDSEPHAGRDRMRHFHRRMRHSTDDL